MSMIGALRPITRKELSELLADPSRTSDMIGGEGEVSLEKMFHAIHFLLTGAAEGGDPPLCHAVLGGTEIGEEIGYGPARYLTPEDVRTVSAALAKLTREEMRRRFLRSELTLHGIYPMIWRLSEDELFEEVMSYFDALVACYRDAAARDCGMLLSVM